MKKDFKYREIPYNYTSFSDREIIHKYFDPAAWDTLNELRKHRVTGRSAKLLFEIIGDIFIIDRNPYILNDFLENSGKLKKMKRLHRIRLSAIQEGASGRKEVLDLIEKVRNVDRRFFSAIKHEKRRRLKILIGLGTVLNRKSISFSAFHKVSHVTDATDWRVEYPEVVVYPESLSEVIGLVKAAPGLDMKIIPRGGGTGLTGGAVPVYKNTMVVNTEKLRGIGEITEVDEAGKKIPVIEVEAGVVTDRVTELCSDNGYIFATDPTSAWASTIGGNIAENCGGKKAVMWGTAIDNIYSFRIVTPEGKLFEVKRKDHPHRKILPGDDVVFEVSRINKKQESFFIKTIELKGTDIRKRGVGKDITNKALGGVPGIQKEGGDGIIVSAKFVLYRPFKFVKTVCLEFFGNNLINASRAIVDILNYYEKREDVWLTALEHFDEKYVSAINYRNKSKRGYLPKAVLLIDIESDSEGDLDRSVSVLAEMVEKYNSEAFIASDENAREQFWKDRKNLGAIARHTNAFKLNEDVVIPIERLPEFADYIEKLNVQKQLINYVRIAEALKSLLERSTADDDIFLKEKIQISLDKISSYMNLLSYCAENLDKPASDAAGWEVSDPENQTVFETIRNGRPDLSIDTGILIPLNDLFHGYDDLLKEITDIKDEIESRKIIIATHMHAGDGNIHVNIPVHSNDYPMMIEADETAGIIMMKTTELGGVISGEHGIGLTKLKYIDQETLDRYAEYKKLNDPTDLFNPGKLRSDFPTSMIYTPSLNLLKTEAFILEAADLKELTASIAACVRCGKCKEVCNTHYPEGTMFYSPRNKILAVSLITEAVLYEVQTRNSLTFRNFKMLREIADHCTMCHNCYAPCPVNIDFGLVSLAIKKLLTDRRRSKFKLITWVVLFYLRRRGYYFNKIARIILLKAGFAAQRLGYWINKPFRGITALILPKINYLLQSRFGKAGAKTLREYLNLKNPDTFYSFHNPEKEITKSVLYFPGCGSERMFPEISIAALALLYEAGVRVVIPPEYLCCGYPLLFNGKTRLAELKSNENRVIFHRMADLINYMGIEDLLVTCGTCFEMLEKYQISNIFPGAAISDLNEFIAREGLYTGTVTGPPLIYHEPCHSPLKKYGSEKAFEGILGQKPVMVPNCCGEGGTMSLSSPQISNQLRGRKRDNIIRDTGRTGKLTVLTSCPSCVQGLTKIDGAVSVKGVSLAVYLAEKFLGRGWRKRFIRSMKKNTGIEKIVF